MGANVVLLDDGVVDTFGSVGAETVSHCLFQLAKTSGAGRCMREPGKSSLTVRRRMKRRSPKGHVRGRSEPEGLVNSDQVRENE
jgi:hypothetical protein